MKEAGVEGVEVSLWYALLALAATPREIVNTLAGAVARATRDPAVREQAQAGCRPGGQHARAVRRLSSRGARALD